jgi:hypothetical protein
VVAVGVVVCAVFANRRKNPARIVLAAGMAVVGLYNLCGVGSSAVVGAFGDGLARRSGNSSLSLASAQVPWWQTAGQGVLAAIALTVFVLLILPAANRYFVAGAGRRFASEA